MNSMKSTMEKKFEIFALWITGNPWKIILLLGLMTLIGAVGLTKIKVDTSLDAFFHKGDSSYQDYESYKQQFGRETAVLILLDPPEIFNFAFLEKLKKFQEELEEKVPYIDEITSILNVTATKGVEGELIVQDFMEDWPETSEDLQEYKEFALSMAGWKNALISENGQQTMITILADLYAKKGDVDFESEAQDFADMTISTVTSQGSKHQEFQYAEKTQLTNEQTFEFVDAINEIADRYRSENFPIYVAGGPAMDQAHVNIIHEVVGGASAMILIIILVLLGLVFRRVSGVMLPALVILFSSVASYSYIGLLGIPLTLVSQIFPSLLLAFSVLDAVHVMTLFYKNYQNSRQKREALVKAIKHAGPAMFFTSLTTAMGFISFAGSDLLAVANLGKMVPFGVMIALVYTLFLLPAVLMLLPLKPGKSVTGKRSWATRIEQGMLSISSLSARNPKLILAGTLLLMGISIWGTSNLFFYFNSFMMFPEGHPVRENTLLIDQKMQGSSTVEIVVDTGIKNGIHHPDILQKLDLLNRYAENLEVDGRKIPLSFSIVDILKQINKSLNANHPDFYSIPQNQNLIAQEFLLFENGGSDDLEDWVDSQFSKARVRVLIPNSNALNYVPILAQLEKEYTRVFAGQATITVTGRTKVTSLMVQNMMSAMSESYILSSIAVSLMMVIFLMSWRTGILSMLPNFFPILLTLGMMGIAGIPLTMMTLLIGAVALGLVVDDTVHFMYNFQKYYEETQDVYLSIQKTIESIGNALFFTTVILTLGFSVFIFTPLQDTQQLGLMMIFTMVVALLSDLVIVPALVVLAYGKKQKITHLEIA